MFVWSQAKGSCSLMLIIQKVHFQFVSTQKAERLDRSCKKISFNFSLHGRRQCERVLHCSSADSCPLAWPFYRPMTSIQANHMSRPPCTCLRHLGHPPICFQWSVADLTSLAWLPTARALNSVQKWSVSLTMGVGIYKNGIISSFEGQQNIKWACKPWVWL